MVIGASLDQILMSAERTLRSVAPTPSATTSLGPSAVNVKMDISSAVMGRPALVGGVCALNTYQKYVRNLTCLLGCTGSDIKCNKFRIVNRPR